MTLTHRKNLFATEGGSGAFQCFCLPVGKGMEPLAKYVGECWLLAT